MQEAKLIIAIKTIEVIFFMRGCFYNSNMIITIKKNHTQYRVFWHGKRGKIWLVVFETKP
ncbi:MAG: hypothetical protein CMC74_10755 [Flavobacteriaceae bacterium]|nr:hypothetical protein [Flavobacteriaceae bacterium]